MICLQSVSFGSYLLANALLYVMIIVYSQHKTSKPVILTVLIVYILANFLSFVTQVSLVMIFISIGKKASSPKKPAVAHYSVAKSTLEASFLKASDEGENRPDFKRLLKSINDAEHEDFDKDDVLSFRIKSEVEVEEVEDSREEEKESYEMRWSEKVKLQLNDDFLNGIVSQFWIAGEIRKSAGITHSSYQPLREPSHTGDSGKSTAAGSS